LDKLHDPATLDALKMTLQKRKKKRLRERRQRALRKEALRESHIRRQQLHQNIDTWLKNMQELVEEAKRVNFCGQVWPANTPCCALPDFFHDCFLYCLKHKVTKT